MKQKMAAVFKQPSAAISLGLLELHKPFSCLLLPVAANHLGLECHVLPQIPDIADFVEILPDVG